MNLSQILAMLKGIVPVLEPIGEQGIEQIWGTIDAEIAKIGSPDFKDIASILSPALKQCLLVELRKLKG